MSVREGQPLPAGRLMIMSAERPRPVDTAELLGEGTCVLFAVPGAFTPTCSARHLPGFLAHVDELAAAGVDRIVCMAVNDIFVMHAWGESAGVGERIVMAADGNGDYTRAMGLETDAREYNMGMRSRRFAMIIREGVIARLLIEAPGEFRISGAEHVLEQLR